MHRDVARLEGAAAHSVVAHPQRDAAVGGVLDDRKERLLGRADRGDDERAVGATGRGAERRDQAAERAGAQGAARRAGDDAQQIGDIREIEEHTAGEPAAGDAPVHVGVILLALERHVVGLHLLDAAAESGDADATLARESCLRPCALAEKRQEDLDERVRAAAGSHRSRILRGERSATAPRMFRVAGRRMRMRAASRGEMSPGVDVRGMTDARVQGDPGPRRPCRV